MNPIQWLLIAAPATVIAAVLFVGVFERVDNTAQIQRETVELKQMEFDQEFASAWNGQGVSAPGADEIEQKKAHLAKLKELAAKAKQEQNEQIEQLVEQLTAEINSGKDITKELQELTKESNNE